MLGLRNNTGIFFAPLRKIHTSMGIQPAHSTTVSIINMDVGQRGVESLKGIKATITKQQKDNHAIVLLLFC